MTHRGSVTSVPSVPLVWHSKPALTAVRSASDRRLGEEDDFEGGRNWALILLFSAMMSAPLWPCLVYLAI